MMAWEWKSYIATVGMSVWVAVDLTHWTWHGSQQAAALTPEPEREKQVLLGYHRFRWLALVVSSSVMISAIVGWYMRSINLLSTAVIAGFCVHFMIGSGSHALRHAWGRIRS